jgi:hypothetical protein
MHVLLQRRELKCGGELIVVSPLVKCVVTSGEMCMVAVCMVVGRMVA